MNEKIKNIDIINLVQFIYVHHDYLQPEHHEIIYIYWKLCF